MGLFSDLKILYHLAVKPVRGKDHAARMESFYAGQAAGYDDFRRRLLKGREELCAAIDVPAGGVWVDLGGGTGSNLEYLGDRLATLDKVFVVDLSESLLATANERIEARGWKNVETVAADATTFEVPGRAADVVTCSYSLTMIPDWFATIDNAHRMLRDGGRMGVVDFYVSRKYPADGLARHRWATRHFWPTWFATDNVFPSADHVPYLHRRFEAEHFAEHRAKVPYLPLMRVPYYTFVGRKHGR